MTDTPALPRTALPFIPPASHLRATATTLLDEIEKLGPVARTHAMLDLLTYMRMTVAYWQQEEARNA